MNVGQGLRSYIELTYWSVCPAYLYVFTTEDYDYDSMCKMWMQKLSHNYNGFNFETLASQDIFGL